MARIAFFVLAIVVAAPVAAQAPKTETPKSEPVASAKPVFVDDTKLFEDFMAKLTNLAKAEKCLTHEQLTEKMKPGTKVKLTPAKQSDKALSPEEVHKLATSSVFVVGSVYQDKAGEWQDGVYATAWVVGADGILVTNWHVFEELETGEMFGALDSKGNVYPMTDFLGGDKVADVAVIRIAAKGLTPLALAEDYAPVGSWVGVLSHPGDNFYVYTTGTITRYSTNKNEDGKRERWMGLTAEYAGGSSGAPVLNKYGAVVGMAALTITLDDHGVPPMLPAAGSRRRVLLGQPAKAPPKEKAEMKEPAKPEPKPAPVGPAVQMILKMAVPGPTILKSFTK